MSRIIDSFLFFQELDLLEVRLEYLYEKVDKFIILESCQTFTGGEKSFYFEDNKANSIHNNYVCVRFGAGD